MLTKNGFLQISFVVFFFLITQSVLFADETANILSGSEDLVNQELGPPGIPTDNMLDELISVYKDGAEEWIEPIYNAAFKLFYYLLVIGLYIQCYFASAG